MTDRRRIDIVIPAYKPNPDMVDLVARLHEQGFGEIVVVNDGSPAEYDATFDAAQGIEGCRVLRHSVNQGKGRALKTAFEYCAREPDCVTDLVTCDADGQHSVEDIVAVADRLCAARDEGRTAVVWGSRDFDRPGIPWKSRLGNKATAWLVKRASGRYVSDTQTGLRGFPREMLDGLLSVEGERFEYEMNVLNMLLDTHVEIDEIPIRTIYHDAENSQSHFRPVRDSIHVITRLGRFALSSATGAVIDLALYALLIDALFAGRPNSTQIIFAVAIARAVSSFVNYLLNRDWVFGKKSSGWLAFFRYYLLVLLILCGSALGSVVMTRALNGHAVVAKAIVDSVLFAASYSIQRYWVFSTDSPQGGDQSHS